MGSASMLPVRGRFVLAVSLLGLVFLCLNIYLLRSGSSSGSSTSTNTVDMSVLTAENEALNSAKLALARELDEAQERAATLAAQVSELRKAFEAGTGRPVTVSARAPMLPIVVVAHKRAKDLEATLQTLLKYRPACCFPVFVTQDDPQDPAVHKVIERYVNRPSNGVIHLQYWNTTKPHVGPKEPVSYYYIARHFGFLFSMMFDQLHADATIVVEEDLQVAPDFFRYFQAMHPLLEADTSLYCVSAFNDNGQARNIDPSAVARVHRSDFMPGLGWMLPRRVWQELGGREGWARGYWDDWLREPQQRKGRACLRPEISRTFTAPIAHGASGGQFQNSLREIVLSDAHVDWTKQDLSYLDKATYDAELERRIANARLVSVDEVAAQQPVRGNAIERGEDLKIEWSRNIEYQRLAKRLRLMDDMKAGVPRTGYAGVVQVMVRDHANTLFIVKKDRIWNAPQPRKIVDSSQSKKHR